MSFATTRSLEAVLRGVGRPLAAGMAEFVALGATAVFLAALLPTLGLIGAAYASLIAYTTSGVWMAWRIKKLIGLKMYELVIPDREGLAVARQRFAGFAKRRKQQVAHADEGRRTRHAVALQRSSHLNHQRRPSNEGSFAPGRGLVPPATGEFFGGPAVGEPEPVFTLESVTEVEPAASEQQPKPATTSQPALAATLEPAPAALQDTRGTCRGMTFEEAHTASSELPHREYGVWKLIWSDYVAHYCYKDETERTRQILFVPRILTNSNLHCNVLVRLIQGTPLWMAWFWRRLLIALHACDFQPQSRIGPGLRMPHPTGIVVWNSVLGRDVVLQHHITISAVTTNWRSGRSPGFVQVGDGVTVFTGTVIAGRVVIGDQAIIGANSLVVRDISACNILSRGRVRPATEKELLGV